MSRSDLREQIEIELASLDMVDTTLREVVVQNKGRNMTRIEQAAVFSLLIQLYSGFEHIFRRVCKFYHLPLPVGDDSHQQLMSRFVAQLRQEQAARTICRVTYTRSRTPDFTSNNPPSVSSCCGTWLFSSF